MGELFNSRCEYSESDGILLASGEHKITLTFDTQPTEFYLSVQEEGNQVCGQDCSTYHYHIGEMQVEIVVSVKSNSAVVKWIGKF
jgi:hypothetical protein